MAILLCKATNELVRFDLDNPDLLINIFEGEDEMHILVTYGDHTVDAVIEGKQPAMQLFEALKNAPLEVTALEIDDVIDDEEEEGGEDEDAEW